MTTVYRIRYVGGKRKTPQKSASKKHRTSSHPKDSFVEKSLDYIDAHKYRIDQVVSPVMWSAITIGAGTKGLDFILDKITSINEQTFILGKPAGKIALAGLAAFALYETGYSLFKGTEKSRIPLVNKIKFKGLWKKLPRQNKALYEKDRDGEISIYRKRMSYLKNFALAGIVSAAILSGQASEVLSNINFSLSELFYKDKGKIELTDNQNRTLDNLLAKNTLAPQPGPIKEELKVNKAETRANLDKILDSQIKKSMVNAELYRMTDTSWDRKNMWMIKRRIDNYESIILEEAKKHNFDPNLVKGIICVESKGDPYAVSTKGAQGLMQLMASTAKHYGVTNPYNPRQNIAAGLEHLDALVSQCEGNLPLALTLYNCQKKAVDWAIAKSGSKDPFVFSQWLQPEPREYAKKILAATTYFVNGKEPEEVITNSDVLSRKKAKPVSPASFKPAEFKYSGKTEVGQDKFAYVVRKGDVPFQIVKKFNSHDYSFFKDRYKPVQFKTDIVNQEGNRVGSVVTPNQIVYILASPK